MAKISPQELQILKTLLDEKIISRNLYDGVVHKLQAYGGHADEVVMEIGGIDEKKLLSALAARLETKFVTSDKLRQASFDEKLLALVPVELAKKHLLFPIAWDEAAKTLTIVTPDANNIDAITEVERMAGARKVRAYVARSQVVLLAIRRWYENETGAFQALDAADMQPYHQLMDVYEQTAADAADHAAPQLPMGTGAVFDEKHFQQEPKAGTGPAAEAEAEAAGFSVEDYLATLQIMLGLIERDREGLKGHSVHVARYMKNIGERIRLPADEIPDLCIAGMLHDMGKAGMYHLTPLNVSLYEGHRDQALKCFALPSKMFENVGFAGRVRDAMDAMYERFDGLGFPDRAKGDGIPIGARILAAADSFSDLVTNDRNPYRRRLSGEEALQVIENFKDDIFDPVIVDALKATVAGDKLRTSILSGQNSILIVDGDTQQGTVLDLNLANRGFLVEVLSDSKAALEILKDRKFDLIVMEANLEPMDGFELLKAVKSSEKTRGIPVMFYTTRSTTNDVDRGFSLGAADYVVKPSSTNLLIAKIMKITKESAEKAPPPADGVSGSLREMSLPDLIQVLSQGRKTGKLRITSGAGDGEIHFLEGRIVNALYGGGEGEKAFYAMLVISEGHFSLDPKFEPSRTVIETGTEGLLLEGLRLLDESQR
jgi:response regulator RpfG family c-di-GMP phosphodiesterase